MTSPRARALELLVWAFVVGVVAAWAPGCGSVELAADGGRLLEADGAAPADVVKGEIHHESPPPPDGSNTLEPHDASPLEAPPAPPSCSSACVACAPYPCAAVVACVRAGDAGAYPWQSCHNLAGGAGDVVGLMCAQRVAAACR